MAYVVLLHWSLKSLFSHCPCPLRYTTLLTRHKKRSLISSLYLWGIVTLTKLYSVAYLDFINSTIFLQCSLSPLVTNNRHSPSTSSISTSDSISGSL